MPPATKAALALRLAVVLLVLASVSTAAVAAAPGSPNILRDAGQPTANYLQFVKNGYKPSGRSSRRAPSPTLRQNSVDGRGTVTAGVSTSSVLATHAPVLPPEYFLSNQTSVGGFRYKVDTQLAELLALIDGRCGFEIANSEQLSPKLLQDHVFMKSAALFKRSRDGLGVFHASSQMPRSRLLGELGHLPASARSGIKIAQFGPDFDIDLYHQSIASLLDDRSAVDQRLAIAPADKLKGTGHDPSTQTYETTALVDGGDKARQPPAAAPKLGFQISQTSNTTKTVFDAAGYEPPPPLDQVIRGDYRGGRGQGQGMIQILSIGPSRAGLPLHVHDESFLHLLGGLKLWTNAPDLAALCVKSPSDAVPHIIRLLKDPNTSPDLHVCLQEPNDILYLPSLWWHLTLNIGEAFGLGYKATDFSYFELDRARDASSYAQDLYGNVAMGRGNFEEAIELYGRATRSEPFQAQFVPNYLRALMLKDRWSDVALFIKERLEYLDDLADRGVLPQDSFCEMLSQMATGIAPVGWYTMRVQPFEPTLRQDARRNKRVAFALYVLRGLVKKAATMDPSSEAQVTVKVMLQASDALLAYGDTSHENDTHQAARLVNAQVGDLFVQLDYNRDRRLSSQEYSNQRGPQVIPFEAADANSDGVVSWEEFRGPKGPINVQRFVAMDSNSDNQVSRKEFNSYYRQHTGSPPLDADLRYFNTLDSDLNGGNGDGVLSRSEFVATRQFPPFDPNIEGVEPVDFL